jgi:hypothetical protein
MIWSTLLSMPVYPRRLFIGWLGNRKNGYTAFLVAIGVMITLAAAIPVIGIEAVLFIVLAFGCSGLPMILGDIWRTIKERERAEQLSRQFIVRLAETHDDQTTRLAE